MSCISCQMPFSEVCDFLGSNNDCIRRINNSRIHIVLPKLIDWEEKKSMSHKTVWAWNSKDVDNFFEIVCHSENFNIVVHFPQTQPIKICEYKINEFNYDE